MFLSWWITCIQIQLESWSQLVQSKSCYDQRLFSNNNSYVKTVILPILPIEVKETNFGVELSTKLSLDGSEITQTSLVSRQFLDRDEL